MQIMQMHNKKLLSKVSILMTLAVAIVAIGLFLRTESTVHAVEGAKPVGVELADVVINQGFAEMIEAVTPAVVSLEVTQKLPTSYQDQNSPFDPFKNFREEGPGQFPEWFWEQFPWAPENFGNKERRKSPPQRQYSGVGAGLVFDPSGLIVTNNHVIDNAAEIRVTLHDGRVLDAEVVGVDQFTDLAVLRINADEQLPYAEFGKTDKVRVGDWAIAIGDPFGLQKSVSLGIVSAMGRNFSYDSPKVPLIQVDAAVNRGNSGGPLFNAMGQVIGINTMIISPSGSSAGVALAVPSSIVEDIVTTIQTEGRVTRGWLGVEIQYVTAEIAGALGLDEADPHGALVSRVQVDSPAEKAGIEVGDIIVSFNGQRIDNIQALSKIVKLTVPGSEVPIFVLRNGERIELQGTVDLLAMSGQQMEKMAVPEEVLEPPIGASVATLTPELRKKYRINQAVKGVVITDVMADSPAAKAGLEEGDVIVSINNQSVDSSESASEVIQSVTETGKSSALLLVADGQGKQQFIVIALS